MDLLDRIAQTLEEMTYSGALDEMQDASSQIYVHLGIKTPDVRTLARRYSQEFRALAWTDRVRLAQQLCEYGIDEVAHLGVFLLGRSIDDCPSMDADALDRLVGAFRGWSVTDAFCIEVLQPLLRRFTPDVLDLIETWAIASNRWKRRASVVVFTRTIGESGRYTASGLRACERLIGDEDDLVRKGVGWALKDLMRGDRDRVLTYVVNLRVRGVSSVITLYALKNVRGEARAAALAVRPAEATVE